MGLVHGASVSLTICSFLFMPYPRLGGAGFFARAVRRRSFGTCTKTLLTRRKSIDQILGDRIDDEGGPLLYAMESEED
jgi:hypothetical protein